MREILFRGQAFGSREWVCGHYRNGRKIHIIYHDENSDNCYAVRPETVGQFTGLTDKNGKKVFDGDILKAIAGNPVGEPIVAKVAVNLNDYELMWDIEHSYEIEVIGNIHDNPELLENP